MQTIRDTALKPEFRQACTPGYYNGEGRAGKGPACSTASTAPARWFFELMKAWREDGEMCGLKVR